MDEQRQKFNLKRSLITIVLVLLAAGVVGGVTWFVMDQNATKEKEACDKSILALENQVKDLGDRLEKKTVGTVTTSQSTTGNLINFATIKEGDNIAGMTLIRKEPFSNTLCPIVSKPISAENVELTFAGRVTVSGEYEYTVDGMMPGLISFTPDTASASKLPKLGGDTRKVWFTFYNPTFAKTELGIGSTSKKGSATVVIDNYSISEYPAEVMNGAGLIDVISHS